MASSSTVDRAFLGSDLSTKEAAEFLGVSKTCVLWWRYGRNKISPAHAKALHERFGLPLHMLRPDVWDPPSRACRRKAA